MRANMRAGRMRIEYHKLAPEASRALAALDREAAAGGLEPSLLDLIRLRASQINGCAYCIDMHTKDARARGENEQRLYGLDAWRETDFYTERERAALAWTESVTLVAGDHVPDAVYDDARRMFTEAELVGLTLAVIAVNGWNRLSIAFRRPAGTYRTAAEREPGRPYEKAA